MKARINNGTYELTIGDDIRISQVSKSYTIFRAKKGICDRWLIEAASDGSIGQLNDSNDEWQILVKTELIEWED